MPTKTYSPAARARRLKATQEWRTRNIDREHTRAKAYYAAHKAERSAARKVAHLRQYGLTPDTFAALLDRQGGGCAICGTSTPGGKGQFHVDHDHDLGPTAVRGLLCHHCNLGLGNFKDDTSHLRQAIAYLQRA